MQLAAGTAIPVVHTVELLDWATGGPVPERLADLAKESRRAKSCGTTVRTGLESR
jgi:glycolate oxidase iron-sulfur subunit